MQLNKLMLFFLGAILAISIISLSAAPASAAPIAPIDCGDNAYWHPTENRCVDYSDDSDEFTGTDPTGADTGLDNCYTNVCNEQLLDSFNQIANFVTFIVILFAFPNGAYGFFQWMTATDAPEKVSKGKSRIKRTFLALGGVALIKFLVQYAALVMI